MNHDPYMSKNQLLDTLKVGVVAGELEAIAKRTPDKKWHQMLATCSTLCKKIMQQRLDYLDKRELLSVNRRTNHTEMILHSRDQIRVDRSTRDDEKITISFNDLYDLIDKSMLVCYACEQGDRVKDCPMAALYHRLDAPALRTNPGPGECEYRYDNERRIVGPDYRIYKTEDDKL